MADETPYTEDDAMRTSANALTKKIYSTVIDVFGNYVGDEEDEYNDMLKTLRNKEKRKCSTPVKSDDPRTIIAAKLIEGYSLSGDVCEKCVMPLMSKDGHVSCVVCVDSIEETKSDGEFAPASSAESELLEEEEELVDKELSQANERRSKATDVYTTKILAGYMMHNDSCSKCDMPMMKYKDLVECVLCKGESKEETPEPVKGEVEEQAREINVDATKPAKELTQAEMVAERLKSMKLKGYDGNVDTELEDAESELLKILGNQGGEIGEQFQDFFSKKKQEREAVGKRIEDAENSVIGAEVDVLFEQESGEVEVASQAMRVIEPVIATPINVVDDKDFDEKVFFSPIAPARWLD